MSAPRKPVSFDSPRKSELVGVEDDGHLGDGALALVADGALDLVTAEARAHVEACEACAMRLADQALAAVTAQRGLDALASAARSPSSEVASSSRRAGARVPRGLVGFALACVVLASVPAIPALLRHLADAPVTARVLAVAASSAVHALAVFTSRQDVSIAGAGLLLAVGVAIAVRASRAEENRHALV
jgi:hypothetical protein